MTIQNLTRRLDRLGGSPVLDVAATLDAAYERERAWFRAGNTGPMPHDPLPPPPENGTRADRKVWRTIAEMHAREIFLTSGEFDELRATYAMNDADLWRVISQREQAR
jgi:hypothetical protein